MGTSKKIDYNSPIGTMLIVFGCILVNFVGKYIAAARELPLWLDCLGTVFAAYLLGPASGALVGCTGNIIYSFWSPDALVYGVTGMFVGLSTGVAARKKRFETLFGATFIAGGVAIGSALISTALNLLVYGGYTGNVWGDGVKAYLMERGAPSILASAAGELYLDFLDKLVTVLALYAFIMLSRRIRSGGKKKSGVALGMLALLLFAETRAVPVYAHAEGTGNTSYVQQVYNADNGLPGGQANDVVQTNDGILWIGCNSGLYRYNGSSFRFMEDYGSVKNVNCMYVDQEGRLWIGTNDNGLVLSINGAVVNTLDTEVGMPSDSVTGIVQNADGDYYIGTAGAMALVRITIGIKVVGTVEQVRDAICVAADAKGDVAAVTGDGRLCLLRDQALFCEVPGESTAFTACAFDKEGILLAGTEDGKVLRYRVEERGTERLESAACPCASRINQLCEDGGSFWVLADNGIGRLENGGYRPVDTGDYRADVRKMTVDYQGNLWFASSRQGLLQLSETNFTNFNKKYGLPEEPVKTTCVRDNILYLGTEHGLYAVVLPSGGVISDRLTQSLEGVSVACMLRDAADYLWLCGDSGLIRVSPDNEITVFEDMDGIRKLSACAELPDGGIAAGGDGGLMLIRDGKPSSIPCAEELGGARILSICGLSDGSILLGTDGSGIIEIKDGAVTRHIAKMEGLPSEYIRRIVPDGETDRLFLVTGSGLCLLENGRITPVSDFPYSDNYDIVPDEDGELFILSSAGIYVVNGDELLSGGKFDYTLLDSRAGLKASLTKDAWNALTADKDLYLSTDRGAVRMNLDKYRFEKRSYRLMVSKIRLDGRAVPIERGSGLTISRDVNTIEFIPEIVNYSFEDPKVSFYLEGVDNGYKTVAQSELTGAIYSNIPSGEYTFHLAILDEDTGRVREESTYGFIKEKSIQDNRWFLVYMLIVGGLFVGWLTWVITRLRAQRTIALQQERLALALKQVQMGNETILAIAKTVDAKDALTSRHSQRVSEYSVMIAKRYGFSEQEQENLRKTALLHDIGKIGIPDMILNKPSSLTDKEYALMKTHVTRGAEILKDFTLIDHVVEGARYHHERYDGKGYPDGLKGEEIPLYGRIIAIADAFDAMTANRVYRKRQVFPYVMDQLRQGRGTQFDPVLLDIFLDVIDSGEIDVASLYTDRTEEGAEEKGEGAADV